jgi:Ser/Thr protein kinase RdoA (MazF antagonist)
VTIVRAADITLTTADTTRAAGLFGVDAVEKIGGFENLLYRSTEPRGRVLRLTHTSRRNATMVEAEFDFMAHLAAQGVPTVAPIPSAAGRLVEEFTTKSGDGLVVACTTEAAGGHVRRDKWSDAWIESYGSLLGSMHRVAAGFEPGPSRRPSWRDPIFDVGFGTAAESDPPLFRRRIEILEEAAADPAGADEMVIHQDVHTGNLFVTSDGQLTVFDFDDSAYGTPTHDVAIVLFYWLFGTDRDPGAELRRFLAHFMRGYEQHYRLPADWPDGADRFLSYRESDIYWLLLDEDPEHWFDAKKRFMAGRRERLLTGVPYLGTPLADML